MKRTITTLCAVTALAAPTAAQAHVTLQPSEVPAGGFTRLDVRVPNERDTASTTRVQVKFPPGFVFASHEPVAGWTGKVTKRKLDTPIEAHGEKITDEIDTVTWTGDGSEGRIGPGQFRDFGLSLGMPDTPGRALTFKALQTYGNGEIVRWIGPADADEPAPRVTLTTDDGDSHGDGDADRGGDDDREGAPTWLAVLGLVVGALGLVAGLAGLSAARRRRE